MQWRGKSAVLIIPENEQAIKIRKQVSFPGHSRQIRTQASAVFSYLLKEWKAENRIATQQGTSMKKKTPSSLKTSIKKQKAI